jgi:hypothetical protein
METLKPGYWVALALTDPVAGSNCYVGQIQAVDARGVRITMLDWIVGTATGFDFYASWSTITGALVATSEHALSLFGDDAGAFQTRCLWDVYPEKDAP